MEQAIDPRSVKKLACALIMTTIRDFMASYGDIPRVGETRARYRDHLGVNAECHMFLSGATEISDFWFQVAEMNALTGSRHALYDRIRRKRGGIES